ncbi:MAG TPA: ABC transporter ATP-binding protein [Rhizomicrobium sp.]|jgi:putative ABC transport system ATP-binding protein|nr:ABC transporter ATP-binding protein [Rhizomicrobium sp.]
MSSGIELRNVVKTYGRGRARVEVLNGLTLAIAAGDFLALMGPSGSGKTTLLNLIGGLNRPDKGEVWAAATRINQLSGGELADWRARHIGFIFQFYNLMPMLTAARNIELPLLLTPLGRDERRKRIATVLDIVGLSARAAHKPSQLSGGEQQRVAIARALVADPEILVCDEPTGDLDRRTADEILSLLQLLNKRGKTIVMVTHDARAAEYATHTVHMDKGVLLPERIAA